MVRKSNIMNMGIWLGQAGLFSKGGIFHAIEGGGGHKCMILISLAFKHSMWLLSFGFL